MPPDGAGVGIHAPATRASAREVAVAPAWQLAVAIGLAVVAVHVLVAVITPYGFHRDEFLYMAMGRNLRLFAMDFPPLIALLAEAQRAALGDALWVLRLAPALAHGAVVVLTGLLAWRLHGGAYAQLLAMIASATAPLYLRAASLFQPVVFDQLWWTLAVYALVLATTDRGAGGRALRHWILFGIACGVGLLTKFSILLFGAAALVALFVSGRSLLRTPGPWLAAVIAAVLGSPSWVGQLRLGLPIVDQMGALREMQLDRIGYGQFLVELVLMHGPAAFMLALAGGAALLALPSFRRWRVAGWTCFVAILIIMALRGKPYYTGPVFPMLYAAGAVSFATWISRVRRRSLALALRATAPVLIMAWSAALLPLVLPVFPPEPTARFAASVGITSAVTTNQGVILPLPQDFADLLGWERKVARIAAAYHALPAELKDHTVILASNYGQAGAIDFFGPRYGLPSARAPIGSYWFWGPGEKPGDVLLRVGGTREALERLCGDVILADRIDEPWVVPEEQDLHIWICRTPQRTLQEMWPEYRGHN